MKTRIVRLGPKYEPIGDATTLLIQALSREGVEYVFSEDETVPDEGGHRADYLAFLQGVGAGVILARVPRSPWGPVVAGYAAVTGPA